MSVLAKQLRMTNVMILMLMISGRMTTRALSGRKTAKRWTDVVQQAVRGTAKRWTAFVLQGTSSWCTAKRWPAVVLGKPNSIFQKPKPESGSFRAAARLPQSASRVPPAANDGVCLGRDSFDRPCMRGIRPAA